MSVYHYLHVYQHPKSVYHCLHVWDTLCLFTSMYKYSVPPALIDIYLQVYHLVVVTTHLCLQV